MTARKVIPKTPAKADEIDACLGPASGVSITLYREFLASYGGGQVFPNSIRLTTPPTPRFSDPVFSVQYFRTCREVIDTHDQGRAQGFWDDGMRPIAVISGGDELLIGVDGDAMGRIYYWTPEDDGLSYRITEVAASFGSLLIEMAHYPDQGKTPPWNRMASVDDAPAVDLILDP